MLMSIILYYVRKAWKLENKLAETVHVVAFLDETISETW